MKYALRGNICRCTGYKKIIEGILLTAKILRGEASVDENLEKGDLYGVGQRAFRVDVRKKVLGFGKYPDDIELDGMAYVSAVRSKYPRARVLKIDGVQGRGSAWSFGCSDCSRCTEQQSRTHSAGLGCDDRRGRYHPLCR